MAEEDYEVCKLVTVIGMSDEFHSISKNYMNLLEALKLVRDDADDKKLVIVKLLLQHYSPTEALEFILSEWRRKSGNAANIAELVLVMKQLEYIRTADLLWNHFTNISALSKIQISTTTLEPGHATAKIPDGSCKTREFQPLLETPLDDGKLSKIRARIINMWETLIIFSKDEANFRKISICKFERLFSGLHIVVSMLFLFVLMSGGGFGGDFGANVASMFLQIRLDIFKATNEILLNTVSTVQPGLMNNESYQISVTSYSEYQKRMHHIPDYIPVNVSIHLKSPEDWPNDVPLKNSGQIKKLTLNGSFDIDKIVTILQEAKHIEELHLIDSMFGLCHRMQHIRLDNELSYLTTVLSTLKMLRFDKFADCNHIYSFFSKSIIMKSLNSFHLANSIIDHSSAPFIQNFLKGHSNSLRRLHFPLTEWNTSIFIDDIPEFPHVNEIHIDFLTDAGREYRFLGNRFHDIFPNLVTFTSTQGFPPWTQFLRLLECKKLSHLTTRLLVPYNADRIKMNFLKNAHRALQFVDISFNFQNKTWTDKCEIEGLESERERFEMLAVRANCDVVEL